MNIDDIIMELKHHDGTPDCSVLEVIECLEQARDTIGDLEDKVAELTGAWKDSIDGVERIAFDMEPPNKHTPRFIMWVNQMRNELNRIKAGG